MEPRQQPSGPSESSQLPEPPEQSQSPAPSEPSENSDKTISVENAPNSRQAVTSQMMLLERRNGPPPMRDIYADGDAETPGLVIARRGAPARARVDDLERLQRILWENDNRQRFVRGLRSDGDATSASGSGSVSPYVQDFCDSGDLVLVVGTFRARFRVNSQCLGCASPIFRYIIESRWGGNRGPFGHAYPTTRQLQLGDEHVNAFYTICCVIHHRNATVPQTLAPRGLLQIAIAARKWDFFAALKFAMRDWLRHAEETDPTGKACLMVTAWLFNEPELFLACSQPLVLHYPGHYPDLLEYAPLRQVLPDKAIYLLSERRNQVRAEIVQILINETNINCSCRWAQDRVNCHKDLVSRYGPPRMNETAVAEVVAELRRVAREGLERRPVDAICEMGYFHDPLARFQMVNRAVDMAVMGAGISLDCFQSAMADGAYLHNTTTQNHPKHHKTPSPPSPPPKMFVDDLLYIRAHLSTSIFSPPSSPSNSASSTPDARSLASHKNKKRGLFSGPRPVVKSANCGAGMKLPMNIA
ncbi:hypothetical protein V8C37DRAFT_418111 [Trichoderma ceciliae]